MGKEWRPDKYDLFSDMYYSRGPLFLEWFYGQTREMWDSGCWEWQGTYAGRYGRVYIPHHLPWLRRPSRHQPVDAAHVISWLLSRRRPIPFGLWILHKCDNKMCVRPSHLYAGTPSDNSRDREERRKYPKVRRARLAS